MKNEGEMKMKKVIALLMCFITIFGLLSINAESAIEWYKVTGSWEESEKGYVGSGGGNGFLVSNIYISGKKDFTFEFDANGEDAFGFGMAIFPDEYAPESIWYCFQADTRSNTALAFHIKDGSMNWQSDSYALTADDLNVEMFHFNISYTAGNNNLVFMLNDIKIMERQVPDLEGWIALKTYECTAEFINFKYTGEELQTPAPTAEPTATPDGSNTPAPTEAPKTQAPSATDKPEDDNGVNGPVILIASVCIVAVAAVITVLVLKKGKKKA